MSLCSSAIVAVLQLAIAAGQAQAPPSASLSGRVLFSGLPVPGAAVTAERGDRKIATVSGDDGEFRLANLEDGAWVLRIEMRGFVSQRLDVTLPAGDARDITLTMRSYEELKTTAVPAAHGHTDAIAPPPAPQSPTIINGSVINGAASPFAQPRAFGNNRPRTPQYVFAVSGNLGSSALNARPYSFGASTPASSSGDLQIGANIAGPFQIPWLIRNGPQTTVLYQHGVSYNTTSRSAVMPTDAERRGDFSQQSTIVRDPVTGLPFDNNVIPKDRISAQASALLAYYPLPDPAGANSGPNYEAAVRSATTQDNLRVATSKSLSSRTLFNGTFGYQRSATQAVNLFAFSDASRQSTLSGSFGVTRRVNTRFQFRATYEVSRTASTNTPFFANQINVSGEAGISGNDQNPVNWGPPTLSFAEIADLTDSAYQQSTRTSQAVNVEASLKRGRHNITTGGDVHWLGNNVSSQPDPRGTLAFTGAATGNGFADFLLGLPTTSAIAFGNTSAHLRGRSYDAYFTDDFRIISGLTANAGVRWEYESPFTEKTGQLANLDVASTFSATSIVLASSPTGALTGRSYPASLLRPDRRGIEPRIAVSWRPFLTSSLVLRASFGVYRNLGTYQPIALMLAQQPPFLRTVSVQSSAASPLTLANPFPAAFSNTTTFAVDPEYRAGDLRSSNVSVQYDLPASLTVIAAYFHDRGSHLMQAFLPNTYPAAALNPCPGCPSGFVYLTSDGRSDRNAGTFTIRRRLYAGFTATLQYTLAKANDDAATFSNTSVSPASLAVAQNWLDLGAEYGPSSFDQRHLVSVQAQYTTGVGVRGGTLIDGWLGKLYKDWTITAQIDSGSGLPLTPVVFSAVGGTGFVGIRPDLTGASISPVSAGSYANPAAFVAPAPGTWGNAGRNSIRGPQQFSMNMTFARVFRFPRRRSLEWRVSATNLLNRVTFASINTTVGSAQFGLPTVANPMRRLHANFVFRF